jgi:hypothetical protein
MNSEAPLIQRLVAQCLSRKEFIEQLPERNADGFGFFVCQASPDDFQERHVVAIAEERENLPSNGQRQPGKPGSGGTSPHFARPWRHVPEPQSSAKEGQLQVICSRVAPIGNGL